MPPKILFVDEDPSFIDTLKDAFQGIDATYVYTSGEGLAQIKHNQFDAVVLDVGMFIDAATFVKLGNGRLKTSKVYFLRTENTLVGAIAAAGSLKEKVSGIFDKKDIALLQKELAGATR